MNIVAVSDTHNMHWDFRLGLESAFLSNNDNVLIHAGDFSVKGTMGEAHSFAEWVAYWADYYKAVIFVAGNHDKAFEKDNYLARQYFKDLKNVYYLQDSGCEIDGYKFWGCPHTIEYHGGFNMTREELVVHHETIPENTDVLITHSPPYGILDMHNMQKLGSTSLRDRVAKIKPRVHIFGHIHPGSGIKETKDTIYVNAGAVAPDSYNIMHGAKYIPLSYE